MFWDEFHIAAIACIVVIIVLWLAFIFPVSSAARSMKKANRKIRKEISVKGDSSFLGDSEFRLFGNRRLSLKWNEYRENELNDVRDHFSPENVLNDTVNVSLLNVIPFLSFVICFIAAAGTYILKEELGTYSPEDHIWRLGIIAGAALISLIMAMVGRIAVFKLKKNSQSFTLWILRNHSEIPDTHTQLSVISEKLSMISDDNNRLLSELNKAFEETMIAAISPFIGNTTDLMERFVLAATDKQAESLDNLVAKYTVRTEEIYSEQIKKISSETSHMAEVQSEITDLLKQSANSSVAASRSVENISALITNVTAKYHDNLSRIDEMNLELSSSVSEFRELAGYIRQNYSSADDSIQSLAASQKEITDASLRANESLKAVAEDMLKAGEILKSNYTGITTDISQDVEKVFAAFDENLSQISVHLSRSIRELQEAVDELPDIIRRSTRDL